MGGSVVAAAGSCQPRTHAVSVLVRHTLIARARRSSFKSSAATRPSGRPSTHHSDRLNLLRRCRPYRGRANREPRATAPPAPATARWLLHVCRNTVTAAGVLLSCVQLVRRTRRAFAPSLRLPRVSGRCAGCVAPRRRSGVALAAVAGKNQDSKIRPSRFGIASSQLLLSCTVPSVPARSLQIRRCALYSCCSMPPVGCSAW